MSREPNNKVKPSSIYNNIMTVYDQDGIQKNQSTTQMQQTGLILEAILEAQFPENPNCFRKAAK